MAIEQLQESAKRLNENQEIGPEIFGQLRDGNKELVESRVSVIKALLETVERSPNTWPKIVLSLKREIGLGPSESGKDRLGSFISHIAAYSDEHIARISSNKNSVILLSVVRNREEGAKKAILFFKDSESDFIKKNLDKDEKDRILYDAQAHNTRVVPRKQSESILKEVAKNADVFKSVVEGFEYVLGKASEVSDEVDKHLKKLDKELEETRVEKSANYELVKELLVKE